MRRRIAALALSAVMAGGTVAMTLPAQTAVAAGHVTCHPEQLRQQIAQLKQKAAKQKRAGHREAARRTLAQADALSKKLHRCLKADEDASKPFPR
ncbi:hypothetical protein [Streptomyces huiliensis]|uniref:hypothetical protein n=1 Tax=Streptomyces huiliensis TaxID=2876027 RepID=UPI001CBE3378|nr:hypothetical protein [Streptomyces huiliensis]MBZ4321400.1 hypothetical protein [Streptomyces huiliensis]